MKKFLKTVIGTIAGAFGLIMWIAVLLCLVTFGWSCVQMSKGTVTDTLPVTPEDFVPEVRIITFTDTHNENENVIDAVYTAYELFDYDEVYPGVDAFFGLGDFTSVGGEQDFEAYKAALDECVREETVIINVLGNHEMKNPMAEEYFVNYFEHELNTVTDVKGFTCIAFSGSRWLTEWTVSADDLIWLNDEIEKAEEKAGDKPIFVFQHPHPFGTVYGSTIWCNPQLNPVFAGHNKVINFSGHSHFPMNDPRSINQTTYTSVGVGAMARFELDKNYMIGQHPEGYEDAVQFAVIEADSKGRVRIRGFDVLSETYFCDYFIEDINNTDTYAYTYKNLKAHDEAPAFPENIIVSALENDEGNYELSFSEAVANAGFVVHNYRINISNSSGEEIYKDQFVNDYYIIDDDSTAELIIPAGVLVDGEKYSINITAESAYHKKQESGVISFVAGEEPEVIEEEENDYSDWESEY